MDNSSMVIEAEFVGQGMDLVPFARRDVALPKKAAKAEKPSSKGVIKYATKEGEKRFLAQVRLKGHPKESKSFGSFKEAADWKQAREAALKSVGVKQEEVAAQLPADMTMAKLFDTYVTMSAEDGHPLAEGVQLLFKRVGRHPILGGVLVSDINLEVMLGFCRARKLEGVVPSTIMSEFVRIDVALKRVGRWLKWGGKKQYDPLIGVREALAEKKLIADSTHRTRRPSPQEMDALRGYFAAREKEEIAATAVASITGIHRPWMPMEDIVMVAAINAFRRGEVVELLWSGIKGKSIECYRKDSSATATGGKRRCVVPVLPAAMEIIMRQPRIEGEDRIFPFNADTISQRFTDACDALNIDDLCFHDLRHEAISTFSVIVSVPEGMLISGHKTVKSYLRYANLEETAAQISDKLAGVKLKTAL